MGAVVKAVSAVVNIFRSGSNFANAVKTVAVLVASRAITKALTKTPKPGTARERIEVEYNGTIEGRRIIYGQMKVSGMNVIPALTSGSTNQYLHQVLALAGHECNSLGAVYFNEEALGTITSISGTADDGKVTTGAYANKAWVRRYAGTDSQSVDFILTSAFPLQWTSSHAGKGIAYIALQYEFDTTVYKNGKPEVTVLVEGKKVYDPRLDSTQTDIPGSGSQRVDDPSTYTYSTNPALCLADYLISSRIGLAEASTRVDWVTVATAAGICDENVSIPGSTTQKRYTCNVILGAVDGFENNIETLVGAMNGACYYQGGKWRVFAGAWSSSAFSLSEADLIDTGINVVTGYEYNERWNSVRGSFVDAARNYQTLEFQPVVSSTYISADGEQAWKDISLPTCTNEYEAQRTAILTNRRSRNGQAITMSCGMSAWKVRPFETGTVTLSELGWSAKTVRCESWRFDPQGFVELVLREEASTDWSDPATGDYTVPGTVTAATAGNYSPSPPTALTAAGVPNGISFSWTAPSAVPAGSVYQLYEHTSATPFSSAVLKWEGAATGYLLPKTDTTTRYYWVRLKAQTGQTSTTEPATSGIAAAAASAPTALNATASSSSVSKTGTTASLTTSSVTVTPTGGSTPYTYSWARISGSTSIAVDSSTAATTTFTGSSLASGTTYNAVFRCTVTDNAAATKTVDVSVEIIRQAMTASASPTTLTKQATSSGTFTTSSTTVTPSGGTSPYTYAWAKVSGDTFTITSSTSASTTFSTSGLNEGDSISGTYRCTVTDSTGGTPLTATADVSVNFWRGYSGTPP